MLNEKQTVGRPGPGSTVPLAALLSIALIASAGMVIAPGAALGVRLTGLVALVATCLVGWRLWMIGVVATAEGLIIRGWLRDRSVSWPEVDHVGVGEGKNAVQPTYVLKITLTNGDTLLVQHIAASALLERRSYVHSLAERLEIARRTAMKRPRNL